MPTTIQAADLIESVAAALMIPQDLERLQQWVSRYRECINTMTLEQAVKAKVDLEFLQDRVDGSASSAAAIFGEIFDDCMTAVLTQVEMLSTRETLISAATSG